MTCALFAVPVCRGQTDAPADLIEKGHWKRACSLVEARVREVPNDAASHFYLSQIRNAFGDRTSPLTLAERAVALDGRQARFHRQLAGVLGVTAQHSGPLQQLFLARRFRKEIGTALEIDGTDLQALRDLTEFYLLAPAVVGGDHKKAKATAERILALNEPEGCLALGRVANVEHRAGDEASWLKRAAEAQPADYRAKITLATYFLTSVPPNLTLAESAAQNALKLDAGRVDAHALLAQIYAAQSRWIELDQELENAARNVPDDLAPFYRAAERIYTYGHDLTRAERYILVYLNQEPEGNEPTLAEGHRLLNRIAQTAQSGRSNRQ